MREAQGLIIRRIEDLTKQRDGKGFTWMAYDERKKYIKGLQTRIDDLQEDLNTLNKSLI